MVTEIQKFEKNAIALEITGSFTEKDAISIGQLFEEKLSLGYAHINILIKVKDLSLLKDMEFKGFIKGELWGIKHFGKLGRCAVVSQSDIMEVIVKAENKILRLFNSALEERYFDASKLDEALAFVNPD